MALKVKAVERLVKFSKEDAGVWRYVMSPELYIALAQDKVIREAALRSGVSKGVMKACWDAAGEVIVAALTAFLTAITTTSCMGRSPGRVRLQQNYIISVKYHNY